MKRTGLGEVDTSDDESPLRYTSKVETFSLEPADFGLPSHPLSQVGGGKLPKQNAAVLMSILRNERPRDDPILHFVLMNVAALLVVSGACDADVCESGDVIGERGPAGGRWKEGVKKARWCIESGRASRGVSKVHRLHQQVIDIDWALPRIKALSLRFLCRKCFGGTQPACSLCASRRRCQVGFLPHALFQNADAMLTGIRFHDVASVAQICSPRSKHFHFQSPRLELYHSVHLLALLPLAITRH